MKKCDSLFCTLIKKYLQGFIFHKFDIYLAETSVFNHLPVPIHILLLCVSKANGVFAHFRKRMTRVIQTMNRVAVEAKVTLHQSLIGKIFEFLFNFL
jgi:hypothetical protein